MQRQKSHECIHVNHNPNAICHILINFLFFFPFSENRNRRSWHKENLRRTKSVFVLICERESERERTIDCLVVKCYWSSFIKTRKTQRNHSLETWKLRLQCLIKIAFVLRSKLASCFMRFVPAIPIERVQCFLKLHFTPKLFAMVYAINAFNAKIFLNK